VFHETIYDRCSCWHLSSASASAERCPRRAPPDSLHYRQTVAPTPGDVNGGVKRLGRASVVTDKPISANDPSSNRAEAAARPSADFGSADCGQLNRRGVDNSKGPFGIGS